jgi:hypothetical protein
MMRCWSATTMTTVFGLQARCVPVSCRICVAKFSGHCSRTTSCTVRSSICRIRGHRAGAVASRLKRCGRCTGVQPELVAQIRFVEWTTEGRLPRAAFLGLRSDKSAREVRRE